MDSVLPWFIRLLSLLLLAVTVAPFLRTGAWYVRVCDFPRLQVALLLAAFVLAWVLWGAIDRWTHEHSAMCVVLGAAALWQAGHVLPYTRFWHMEVPDGDEADFRLLISNIEVGNERAGECVSVLREHDADVLLLIEIDERWARQLESIRPEYAFRLEDIRPDGLGIALWSKLPLEQASVRTIVSDERPSVHATIRADGGVPIRFVGVHPTPPALRKRGEDAGERYDSRIRDAELLMIAKEIADDPDSRWMVAGDFNDVAWSRTTREFQRVSGLGDPRVGRAMLNTYHAQKTLWRYPIDHSFVSPGLRVASLGRIVIPGSDHFAVSASFDIGRLRGAVDAEAAGEDVEELIEDGGEDATRADWEPAN